PGAKAPTVHCGFSKASERHRWRFFARRGTRLSSASRSGRPDTRLRPSADRVLILIPRERIARKNLFPPKIVGAARRDLRGLATGGGVVTHLSCTACFTEPSCLMSKKRFYRSKMVLRDGVRLTLVVVAQRFPPTLKLS